MSRSSLFLSVVAAIALTGSSRSATRAAAPLPASAHSLVFATAPGTVPVAQIVALTFGAGAAPPALEIAYAGKRGWLRAGISGSGERRSLNVQPISERLSPGVYRATLSLGEGGAVAPARVDVRLVVSSYGPAKCPPGSTLRYIGGGNGRGEPVDFGKNFLGKFCTRCHSSAVPERERQGAPVDLNWDSPSIVREQRLQIDAVAGRGPNGPVEEMPPLWVESRPAPAERELLAQWLACGAP
jgi:hypothetical protein